MTSKRKYILKLNEEQLLLAMGLLAEERDLQNQEAEAAIDEDAEGLLAVAEERLLIISNTHGAIQNCRVVNADGKFIRMTSSHYQRLLSQM